MVSSFVLAALQLSSPEIDAMARDFLGPERYSNRLDCVSRSRRESAEPTSAPAYESNSVFVFPLRPHLRREGAPPMQVRYVRTMRDGRSFIREAVVRTARLERWPNFSAQILENDGEIVFESDPLNRGRVTLSGRHPTSHGPHFEERGDCRFVPDVPTNGAPAR